MPAAPAHSRALRSPSPRRGFTLIELIVAAVMVAFIAAATTIALSQIVRARDGAAVRLTAFARAQAAAERMAQDVESIVRDGDLAATRFVIQPGSPANTESRLDGLLVFSRTAKRVRPSSGPLGTTPEGGELEVQYRADRVPGALVSSASLLRRADPNRDEVIDGGGVVSPVADGVLSIAVQAFDGVGWYDDWDSDLSGYPHAVRITVVAADDSGRYTAAARRTVAIDRIPPPLAAASEEDTAATATTPSTTPSSGGTGSGSGSGAGAGGGGAGGGAGRGAGGGQGGAGGGGRSNPAPTGGGRPMGGGNGQGSTPRSGGSGTPPTGGGGGGASGGEGGGLQ
ncbi:MAG: prepilin-type N-terminal cleavage/methylation domain-containing protein [Phycisphaeraceae bacterium]|nr:prepilin-type N-terminal cleavage/methylation domain-containing protein [Phycisphaeraceae bacterium]